MDLLPSKLVNFVQNLNLTESQLAYGSTLLISIAPLLVLFLFKIQNTAQHRNKLRLALSFASGGLLGDVFLHLIPHSMGNHHHHHHHEEHQHHSEEHHHNHKEQTIVGLYIILGIILFFVIEKFVHLIKGESHSHHHHNYHKKEKISDSEDDCNDEKQQKTRKTRDITRKLQIRTNSLKGDHDSDISQTRLVSGILNLIADFLHNFTDGMAIGATFSAGQGLGAITAMTILLHEIPHEIGDYAILIQAGYRRKNALALQLVTAIGALVGTAIGLHYGTLERATQLILPITAGGFIYIATVNIIPELLEKTNRHIQSFYEIISLFVGVAMMYWIALNE